MELLTIGASRYEAIFIRHSKVEVGVHVLIHSLILSGNLTKSAKTVDLLLGSHGGGGRELVGTSSDLLSSLFAFPDADSLSLHALLLGQKGC